MNPLRAFSALLNRFTGAEEHGQDMPRSLGYWPGALALLVFVWLELVYDKAAEPTTVLAFVLMYSIAQIAGANIYGMGWYSRGDGFEVYSTLLSRFAPLGRDSNGRLTLRNPFRGLAGLSSEPGLLAVVAVLLGSTAFDGLTRTRYWADLTQGQTGAPYLLLGTLGLVGAIGFVALTYKGAIRLTARLADENVAHDPLAGTFIHSLIPIAVGYTIAHYFSLFVFQGQAGYILATDPYGTGADLLGTKDWTINYLLVTTSAIALVQVGSIVFGHIAGVVSAHDRALEVLSERHSTRAQYPLLAVMVLYTIGGIALLVGT